MSAITTYATNSETKGKLPTAPKAKLQSCDIQAKLEISQSVDIYEQEADRLAKRIMRMTDGSEIQRNTISKKNKKSNIPIHLTNHIKLRRDGEFMQRVPGPEYGLKPAGIDDYQKIWNLIDKDDRLETEKAVKIVVQAINLLILMNNEIILLNIKKPNKYKEKIKSINKKIKVVEEGLDGLNLFLNKGKIRSAALTPVAPILGTGILVPLPEEYVTWPLAAIYSAIVILVTTSADLEDLKTATSNLSDIILETKKTLARDVSTSQDITIDESPKNSCKDIFKDLIECKDLEIKYEYWGANRHQFLNAYKRIFGKDLRFEPKRNPPPASKGPCKGKEGSVHIKIEGVNTIATLGCCRCCEESGNGPLIKEYCRPFPKVATPELREVLEQIVSGS